MQQPNEKIQQITQLKSGVERLTLTDFRNYKNLRLEVPISPIVISGANGTGKTNILEALSFLTPGRGLRSARLADIKRIHSVSDTRENIDDTKEDELRVYERRIVKIDGQKITQQSELGKYISAIWITPQMDRLFLGGPQPRRSFLDRLVYAFDLEHAKRTANFEHLYRQWYQLLKSGCNDHHWLQTIESDMAALGVAIAAARRELIARLNTFITQEPDDVFPSVRLELAGTIEKMLNSAPAIKVEDFYASNLQKQRRNIVYNDSADGVNRTDFKVYMQQKNMPAELCSTGEQKALLVSIILAQTKCQILDKGFAPVLLLDEVTTHLDDNKRDALLSKIKDLQLQAWITSTDATQFAVLHNFAQFLETTQFA